MIQLPLRNRKGMEMANDQIKKPHPDSRKTHRREALKFLSTFKNTFKSKLKELLAHT